MRYLSEQLTIDSLKKEDLTHHEIDWLKNTTMLLFGSRLKLSDFVFTTIENNSVNYFIVPTNNAHELTLESIPERLVHNQFIVSTITNLSIEGGFFINIDLINNTSNS